MNGSDTSVNVLEFTTSAIGNFVLYTVPEENFGIVGNIRNGAAKGNVRAIVEGHYIGSRKIDLRGIP